MIDDLDTGPSGACAAYVLMASSFALGALIGAAVMWGIIG